ncbi:N-acetylmuramoyl-L-alanine amidase [Geomicrobium sp. JCM 19038]|nr:N-acetylmuramoyl-L-alanine amidase [Geomicrobium sp. JCM 19038]
MEHIDEELFLRFVQEVRKLMSQHGLTANDVIRHSDVGQTNCPGRNFPWARFKRLIAQQEEVKSIVYGPKEKEAIYVKAGDFQWASGKERFETILNRYGNSNEQEAYKNDDLTASDAMGVLAKGLLAEPSKTVPATHMPGWKEMQKLKTPDGTTVFNGVNPNKPISRAQMATVLSRLLEIIKAGGY